MKLIHPTGQGALACLRAMRTVTAGEDPLRPAVRALMVAAQRVLMSLDVDLEALQSIDAAELDEARARLDITA